jgi:hypothetical protein
MTDCDVEFCWVGGATVARTGIRRTPVPMLGSAAIQPKQGDPMLRTVDRLTAFSEIRLSTTDPKIKVRVNKCSTCAALVAPMDTHQHRKFHEDMRAIAKDAGLAR